MRNRRILIGLVAALLSFPVIAQNAAKSTRKQAATENADTLSGIWSQNWILKLKPHNGGYQLDTVSVLYEKYCLTKTGIPAITLPSTSPANCRMTYDDLKQAYAVILPYLR